MMILADTLIFIWIYIMEVILITAAAAFYQQ